MRQKNLIYFYFLKNAYIPLNIQKFNIFEEGKYISFLLSNSEYRKILVILTLFERQLRKRNLIVNSVYFNLFEKNKHKRIKIQVH